ncbi:MAG: xanthine dehydrogenase subunit D [Streptomycetales bacterium]
MSRAYAAPLPPTRIATPAGVVGQSAVRPDGLLKVTGDFAYASDLWAENMLWGLTVRSPHAHARIQAIDITGALQTPGVFAVLSAGDVPGANSYGLDLPDQPVLAGTLVRYQGEPVAVLAADHPETARRAAERVHVDYQVLDPLTDPELALAPDAPKLHPSGNLTRHVRIRRGDSAARSRAAAAAAVVVTGEYQVGMQDQAPLGPESGLALPCDDGGVDLYVATQWLHVDRGQLAAALALPPEKVRLTLSGVGGAFGAREDLSIHVHACLLALHTGRPVKMSYTRQESFVGHVHRHPGRLRYTHGAARDGTLVFVEADILLDGGAYASSSPAVCSNAACFAVGPYQCGHASIDARVVYTNNPPCGAMRGFGAVQTCFAYESQMDRLAAALDMDPLELRARNAMRTAAATLPTGQHVAGEVPVGQYLTRLSAMALPPQVRARSGPPGADLTALPGGVSNATHGEGVRRGVGYALGFKNVGFSEGFDDYSTARVRLHVTGGEPSVEVHTAAAEVGQGLVTVQGQIARTELGVAHVIVRTADTQVGSAGSTSASRQSYLTGGAVKAACEAVRERLVLLALQRHGHEWPALLHGRDGFTLRDGKIIAPGGDPVVSLADLLGETAVEETREFRHQPTAPLDPETGQGDAHVQYSFAAHRAIVDVDVETGLVRVVELAVVQDVGRALNPQAVEGQLEGGSAQGLGLAVMEELQLRAGRLQNPSFTDYLVPTVLDMPPVRMEILELADPQAPYGVKGAGEAPTISSTPAIVAAIRDATGRPLTRVPVRPEHVVDVASG